jgi:prepilin-type N-terminal cleavage/methylation domain-containing protein
MMMLQNRRRRGFTLIEMVIVLAIMGVVGGLAFPALIGLKKRYQVSQAAREFSGYLQRAKADATAHVLVSSGPNVYAASAGLTINSATTYSTWIDSTVNGVGVPNYSVDLTKTVASDTLVTVGPVNTGVRFSKDGTLIPANQTAAFTVTDGQYSIQVLVLPTGRIRVID